MRNKSNKAIISVHGIQVVPYNPKPQAYSTPFSIKSQKWYDELSDSDPFNPSCPHLHSKEGPYKMNVYTGEIYNTKTKKIIEGYGVREKDLKKLWNDKKFVAFALTMRKLYFEKFPDSELPKVPEYCKLQNKVDMKVRNSVYGRRTVHVHVKVPVRRL